MRGTPTRFAALALALATPVFAQASETPDPAPAEAARIFMTAFNAKDAQGMSALVMEGATLAVIQEREGEDRVAIRPLSGLVEATASASVELAEPTWNFRTLADGPVATVFADYEFRLEGKRSHCGTNVFQMLRVEGEWKISGMSYSHIVEPCEGPPAP